MRTYEISNLGIMNLSSLSLTLQRRGDGGVVANSITLYDLYNEVTDSKKY